MKKILIVLLTLLSPLIMCAEDYTLVLNSGHTDAALCIAVDEARNLIYTGGRDGTVRIWRADSFSLLRKIQISKRPIRKIDLDPKSRRLAVVESDGGSDNYLAVWDTEKTAEMFRVELPEVPLVLSYSPQGNFISVSKTDWQSLSFFDATTGSRLSYLKEGFGIVSFLYVSASENTLISYTPSTGNFTYWNLKAGTVKGTVKSIPELKNLVSYNERYAVGELASELVVIDLVTGAVAARTNLQGIRKIVVNPKNLEIAVLARLDDGLQGAAVSTWNFSISSGMSGGFLTPRFIKNENLPAETSDIALMGNSLLAALPEGTIGSYEPYTLGPRLYGENLIEPITDLLFKEGYLYLATKEEILSFKSDFFTETGSWKNAKTLSFSSVPNPLHALTGLLRGGSGNLILWKKDANSPGRLFDFDSNRGFVLGSYENFKLPLTSVQEFENSLYAIESNGSLKKFDSATLTPSFSYQAAGLQTLTPLGLNTLIAGKSVTGSYGSPLVFINTLTGETVPIEKESLFIVYSLESDRRKNILYFLGLRKSVDDKTETVLYSGTPTRLESSEPVATLPYADIEADIHVDTESSLLFTTMGNGGVRSWDGSRWKIFENNNNRPGKLYEQGGVLYALNAEGSVSAWDKSTGRHFADLYMLKNGSWIILTATGYFISPNPAPPAPLLSIYRNGAKIPESGMIRRRLLYSGDSSM